jgi:hypothetical protein
MGADPRVRAHAFLSLATNLDSQNISGHEGIYFYSQSLPKSCDQPGAQKLTIGLCLISIIFR